MDLSNSSKKAARSYSDFYRGLPEKGKTDHRSADQFRARPNFSLNISMDGLESNKTITHRTRGIPDEEKDARKLAIRRRLEKLRKKRTNES